MGYQHESYDVKSHQAGYIINVNRMINPLADKSQIKRVILFLHGMAQNSLAEYLAFAHYAKPERPTSESYSPNVLLNATDHWDSVTQKPTNATCKNLCLPCLFANNNYDVWLLDTRGATNASSQVDLDELRKSADKHNASSFSYWDYSRDDEYLNDLPAVIDFIRDNTNIERISCVGFSLGNIYMFSMLALKPDYADKLKAVVALAPVWKMSGSPPAFYLVTLLEPVLRGTNLPIILDSRFSNYINAAVSLVCNNLPLLKDNVCSSTFDLLLGPDTKRNNIFVST